MSKKTPTKLSLKMSSRLASRARLAGRRAAHENHIEVLIVITDPRGSCTADGHSIAGSALAEIVDALHVGARVSVQELLDMGPLGYFRNLNIFDLGGRRCLGRGLCLKCNTERAQIPGEFGSSKH